MRHLREIFRQKLVLGLAHRAIAQSVGVSLGAVATALSRARAVGLDWAQVQEPGDDALEQRVYGGRGGRRIDRAPLPDPAQLHVELRRTGVTLQLLHLEYLDSVGGGVKAYGFAQPDASPPHRRDHGRVAAQYNMFVRLLPASIPAPVSSVQPTCLSMTAWLM
jgi:hypothetical protein